MKKIIFRLIKPSDIKTKIATATTYLVINQFVLLRLLTLGQRKYVSSMKNSHLQVSSQKPSFQDK